MRVRVLGYTFLITLAVFCFVSISWGQGADKAERVLFNAKIFTGVPDHPYAEAVALRGDKIVAVGSLPEVLSAIDKNAARVDLQGKFLLPGLIDSHVHPMMAGISLISADVSEQQPSLDALSTYAAEVKKNGKGMRGDVLYIGGIPLVYWSNTKELNARFSSGAYADVPVFLRGSDGHTGWANQALLRRAGVTKDFLAHLSPGERAYYGIDPGGEPNGFTVDAGREKIDAVIPEPSQEQYLEGGRAAIHYLHSMGITSWLDALAACTPSELHFGPCGKTWSGVPPVLATYRELAQRGELTAHVVALPVVNPRNDPAEELEAVQKLRREFANIPNLSLPGIKVFADGVLEYPSQTAAMTKPYKNTGKSGDLLFDPARFAELATLADKQGLIVHVHALGDRAVKETLNGLEAARKANGNSGLPHTLTHLQVVDPEDFPRFRQLGVIAAFQLLWATAEPDTIELIKPYLDPELYRWQYPARSILDAGGTISGASDWFVSSPNVFWAIYQAETRKGPEGVLDANQCVPREAMFYAYTRNSARALNQQDKIGSLAPGMQADLVLLDRDVLTVTPEEMRDTKVLWTMVGGVTVYRAQP